MRGWYSIALSVVDAIAAHGAAVVPLGLGCVSGAVVRWHVEVLWRDLPAGFVVDELEVCSRINGVSAEGPIELS